MYALGTVLWEVLSGELPFDGEFPANIRRKIVSGYTHPMPAKYVDTVLGDLVSSCWSFDPTKRPTSKEMVATLESMLHDQCYGHIKNIDAIPDTTVLRTFYDQNYRKSVYGDSRLHKYLFADLSEPSFLQYLNPCNWIRYWYFLYNNPGPAYNRALSDDGDSDDDDDDDHNHSGSGNTNSSLIDRDSELLAAVTGGQSAVHRQLFDGEKDTLESSESGTSHRSSYRISNDAIGSNSIAHAMGAQLPRAAIDVIGVIKVLFIL